MDDALRTNRTVVRGLVAWLIVVWLITAVQPVSRRDWLLENILVFVVSGVLVSTYRRFAFSTPSYVLLTAFMTLHLVGAHYTYSEVPLGFLLRDALGLSRNPYDRIAHFSFGLLVAYPYREWLLRVVGVRPGWSYAMAIVLVLSISGLYEVTEGIVAMIVSPELGADFLGIQGDEWDAQKDTAAAFLGAVGAMLITRRASRARNRAGRATMKTDP